MDSSFHRQLKQVTSLCDQLVPEYIQRALELQNQYRRVADCGLGTFLINVRALQSRLADSERIAEKYQRQLESARRWSDALTFVQTELPKRGWYLTGQERARLNEHLASLAQEHKWNEIDQILVSQAAALRLEWNAFANWLRQHSVSEHCVERVRIFLKARDNEEHEVATLVGVPLIDELSRALYDGKDFTSKRTKRLAKPQMACATNSGAIRLTSYCKGFVDSFGLIHEDVDPARVEDEDYFNRSAILHGLMRRSYGPKDSAKTFMALMFVVFAFDDGNPH